MSSALELLLDAAARHADRVAIEGADGTAVTYRALVARARAYADEIARGPSGRAPGATLVVRVEGTRSADFVARCLGAWLAGAAWCPVDPGDPRVAAIPARFAIDPRTLVTSSIPAGPAADAAAATGAATARAAPHAPSRVAGELARVAYVIATSGSTGTPKRVVVGHAGIAPLWRAQLDAFALAPGARCLWLHAPVFDASLSDWGTALAAGATLVVPSPRVLATPAALADELAARAITHVDLPPALLPYLGAPPALRVVVLGGEACPVEAVRALARRVRVVVVYGPTEATVCSSLVVVDPARWTRPLIGTPLPGITYGVRDGELVIAGAALALGYADDPAETARRFVDVEGARRYRTGDRVEAVDGGLAFVGRVDRELKLAGRRVELGAIEAALRALPGVGDAAVVARMLGGAPRAIAFVEPLAPPLPAPSVLRAALAAVLPAWMLPAQIVFRTLPRTATGKLDRAALATAALPAPAIAHADPLARELAALWCEAIGCGEVADADRFVACGGDSLARLTLHVAAAAHGLAIADGFLAADPTFAQLVAHVRAAGTPAPLTVEACEQRVGEAPVCMDDARVANVVRGAADAVPVLVTGATGLLGRALLRVLARPVIALVRAPDDRAARGRLADAGGDVEVIRGDVARPRFGLSVDAYRALGARVGAVVHAAATIRLADGWDAHAATNVGGTAEVARFARGFGLAWHHVSTLSVFVGTDRGAGRHPEEATPDPHARARGGYAQTKIAAEAIARAARGRAAPTMIARLGLLVPEGADAARAGDQLALTIRGLARLGAMPAGCADLAFDVTPVAYAARALAALAARAERRRVDATHHVCGPRAVTLGELAAALRAAGVALEDVPPSAWAARARARLADPAVAMAYGALVRAHGDAALRARLAPLDLCLATDATFAGEHTRALLAELGVPPPTIDVAAITRAMLEDR